MGVSRLKRFLVSGIRGQDGRIAAKLLGQHHQIVGLSHGTTERAVEIAGCSKIYFWDWEDKQVIEDLVKEAKPDFFLNFAACHHSSSADALALDNHRMMMKVNLMGLSSILQSLLRHSPETMLIHTSSSQIYTAGGYGDTVNENSVCRPATFYGYTKHSGMQLIDYYRRQYGLKASNVILFNHESEFRQPEFVTRTISNNIARIKRGLSDNLHLRNIGAIADFSSAYDFVRAMVLICESGYAEEFIISSGVGTSVLDLVKYGFEKIEVDWQEHTSYDRNEVSWYLVGDNTKLRTQLDWSPEHDMRSVMESMIDFDLAILDG